MTPQQQRLAQALGAILRSRRAWHLLTQADLAAATGIHRTRVGSFERGRLFCDVWEATQLARALQLPLLELLQPCLALSHSSPEASQEGTADRAVARTTSAPPGSLGAADVDVLPRLQAWETERRHDG